MYTIDRVHPKILVTITRSVILSTFRKLYGNLYRASFFYLKGGLWHGWYGRIRHWGNKILNDYFHICIGNFIKILKTYQRLMPYWKLIFWMTTQNSTFSGHKMPKISEKCLSKYRVSHRVWTSLNACRVFSEFPSTELLFYPSRPCRDDATLIVLNMICN